jgi:hypothetical protein
VSEEQRKLHEIGGRISANSKYSFENVERNYLFKSKTKKYNFDRKKKYFFVF